MSDMEMRERLSVPVLKQRIRQYLGGKITESSAVYILLKAMGVKVAAVIAGESQVSYATVEGSGLGWWKRLERGRLTWFEVATQIACNELIPGASALDTQALLNTTLVAIAVGCLANDEVTFSSKCGNSRLMLSMQSDPFEATVDGKVMRSVQTKGPSLEAFTQWLMSDAQRAQPEEVERLGRLLQQLDAIA